MIFARSTVRVLDLVTGSYTVADPDGRIRTVTYTADAEHGFQAKVTYDGEEGPVAIPFNTPTETDPVADPVADPVIVAKDIEQSQPQPQSDSNDEELAEPEEVKTVESNVPSLFNNGLRLPAVFNSVPHSVPRVFSSPETLSNIHSNIHSHSFPQFFSANSPRFVSSVPRVVTTVPRLFNQLRAVPSLQALLHNNLHQVQALPHGVHHALPHGVHHALPHGVAVRAGAAPLDLSQFTFLSNGQVVG